MANAIHAMIYTSIALFLLIYAGNLFCRLLFKATGFHTSTNPKENNEENSAEGNNALAGRFIGALERLLIAIGITTNSWEVLAAVIALKTVARFKELDKQNFAEYFLVGSLFSILWAVIITGGWLLYDHSIGVNMSEKLSSIIEAKKIGTEDIQTIINQNFCFIPTLKSI